MRFGDGEARRACPTWVLPARSPGVDDGASDLWAFPSHAPWRAEHDGESGPQGVRRTRSARALRTDLPRD